MNRITLLLTSGMDGPQVANLQDGLRFILERRLLDLSEDERLGLLERLRREREAMVYGDVTGKIVGIFQERNGLDATGEVDAATAEALNAVLADLGAFDGEGAAIRSCVVAGTVVDQDGKPYPGLDVSAYHVDDRGQIRLGSDRSDAGGHYTVRFDELAGVPEVVLSVEAATDDGEIVARSEPERLAEPVARVDLSVTRPVLPRPPRRVEGRIVLESGAPATSLGVRLYRLEFGGEASLVDHDTTTATGSYVLEFDEDTRTVVLEVRAAPDGCEEVTLSKPLTVAAGTQVVRANLVAPADLVPVEAEYTRLAAAVAPQMGELSALAEAREDEQRRDLTTLHATTGWDARALALAATAQKLAQDHPDARLRADALYGLFRAGLPRDEHLLARLGTDDVGVALTNLAERGIVAMRPDEVAEFTGKFSEFARGVRLAVTAPGSQTTYGAFLDSAGVGDDGDAFADVFLKHRGSPAELWSAARDVGVSPETIGRLQWQGRLAFLAGNSGRVTEHLMAKLEGEPLAPGTPPELKGPVELVSEDLYEAERWKAEVRGLAADDEELAALIPSAYAGTTVDSRLDAYAADMARKIRVSYPTEVVTRMVETDRIGLNGAKDATVMLLQTAAPQGFKLGHTPIEHFLSTEMALPEGMPQDDVDRAKQGIKTLHRVYQITPDNESMAVLTALGLESAFDVTALQEHEFYFVFEKKYFDLHGRRPAEPVTRLVWRKAQQVSSLTYTIFGVTKKLDADLTVPVVSGGIERRTQDRDGLAQSLKGYPTMEELFGSMDFCECEHCRSVLGPAAYLVDLLQFVEGEPQARANFLQGWEDRNGSTYGAAGFLDPYDELVRRRPDLPHIPLTCENTNVALPYIDVVNEILEYFVAHDKLTEEAAGDTGEATTAELLAEPQNVVAEAYRRLVGEKYPLMLPFDLWLETLREFCTYAGTPLHEVLETFRTSEELLPVPPEHGWAGIFLESLGLSPTERAIFTDADPLAAWWELYGYATEADATDEATDQEGQRIDLNSARALSRRLGVTYKELVRLVRTRFVNPNLAQFGLLYKLPASIAELETFLDPANRAVLAANRDLLSDVLTPEQQERIEALTDQEWERLTDLGGFADRVQVYADEYGKTVDDVIDELEGLDLDDVLVLAAPDAGCNFDETILRQADGEPAGADVFLRLNLFVRLWRKLGWSLDEVDHALVTFIPAEAPFEDGYFDQKPLETALIYLAHLKVLNEKLEVGKPSRTRLLMLWTDIPTEGKDSLYGRLFLTRSVLKADPIFDHPRGEYLAADWVAEQGQGKPAEFVLIRGHLPAIQSALGLTAEEVRAILSDARSQIEQVAPVGGPPPAANEAIERAKLTIANLSVLHRYGLLAKALRISVVDLITLKALSGRDPFEPLAEAPLTELDEDHPYTETLKFVEVAEQVKRSGFTIADLDFLLRRRFDEAGPRRQHRAATLTLLATLADGIRAIRTEHAVRDDPGEVTEEFLQQKLGLLLSPLNVATVLRMVRGEEDVAAASTRAFFRDVLERRHVGGSAEAGFLGAADYPALFEPVAAGNQTELLKRRRRLADAFLPVLQNRLIRQLVVQTLAADTGSEPELVEQLITDADLLAAQADGATEALIEAFTAAADDGIEADFYASTDGGGPRQDTPTRLSSADTGLRPTEDTDGVDLPVANSARFRGYIVARAAGPYRFFIDLEKEGAHARLSFDHLATPTFLEKEATEDDAEFGTEPSEYVELQATVPYRFSFELDALSAGGGRLTVQGETTPRGPLSQLALYPAAGIEGAEKALTRLLAALELVGGLSLTLREAVQVLRNAANWADVNLSGLPTAPTGDTEPDVTAATSRFAWFLRLAEYADVKAELTGGTDDLVDVFEANATGAPNRLDKVYERLAQLTRRDSSVVRATAKTLFGAEPDFADDRILRRLWDALQLVERLGAPASSIRGWTTIVAPRPGPDAPSEAQNLTRFTIARELKETVKARFDPETWQRVAQPIFDLLRKRQRDALVAAIMHRKNLVRAEQLYEYFLVDPGMEPVVQTSRIRLAIGSVQLFIQRCLLNLEPRVHPSALLNAEQWDWMKRYRVWEANRKIFLFPENWLEPEFRDEKTHLFDDLESALLENDVSADVAEGAFLTYLTKLAALAKLEIVAMHLESKPDFARNTLHVFARTYSTPHKYFYRRYANRMWTPWQPVDVDIEGDHIAPVVWRERLCLFWVTFMESGRTEGAGPTDADDLSALPVTRRDVEAQLHWSEYVAGEWQTHESGGYQAPRELRVRVENLSSFDPQTVFVHVDVVEAPDIGAESAANLQDVGVYINIGSPFDQTFRLASRHSPPVRSSPRPTPYVPFGVDKTAPKLRPTSYVGSSGELTVSFRPRIITGPGQPGAEVASETHTILGTTDAFTLLPVNNRITLGVSTDAIEGAGGDPQEREAVKAALEATIDEIESLIKPVFVQDAHQVLFVEPEVIERTVQQWEEWVTRTPGPGPEVHEWYVDPDFWDRYVVPLYPEPPVTDPIGPIELLTFNESLMRPTKSIDWLVNPGTGLLVDGYVIGSRGLAPVQLVSTADVTTVTADGGAEVAINVGSGIAAGTGAVLYDGGLGAAGELTQLSAGVSFVGNAGLNPALLQSVDSVSVDAVGGVPGHIGLIG